MSCRPCSAVMISSCSCLVTPFLLRDLRVRDELSCLGISLLCCASEVHLTGLVQEEAWEGLNKA